MSLEGGTIGTSQGDINKVMPGVEVTKRGGHVDREVVPLEAVLLGAAHGASKGFFPELRKFTWLLNFNFASMFSSSFIRPRFYFNNAD